MREEIRLERLQEEVAGKIVLKSSIDRLDFIAGCDVAYRKNLGCAAVVLLSYPALETVQVAIAEGRVDFPYIPGLLAFRESPLILTALQRLRNRPHCLIADGHGIAHPRGAGLASHLGVLTQIPTIGCAKTLLVGDYAEPDAEKGSVSPLILQGKSVGCALRTRSGVKPTFVSPGHLVDVKTAVEIVLSCSVAYRTPEPLRIAHIESRKGLPNTRDSSKY